MPASLPEASDLPIKQWIDWVTKDIPAPEFDIEEAVRLTKLMEAAYKASETGRAANLS